MSIIQVDNLTRVYKAADREIIANDNLSFSVQRGEIFGLLGHNGAGKTTLMMQLMGLIVPTSGSIIINGIDVVKTPSKVKNLIGFLPQKSLPLRFLELHKSLYFTGRLRGMSDDDARQQAETLISALGMESHRRSYVNQLSGGLLRLTNFAMALMGNPPVLILDEPTNDLDPQHRRQVWEMIRHINEVHATTCLIVTHNLLEAERVVQRVAVLQHGKIIHQGTPGEIKRQVQTVVQVELWLKTLPELPRAVLTSIEGEIKQVRPGHYQIMLPQAHAQSAIQALISQMGFDEFDDFRIAPPSLEDVYHQLQDH